MPLWLQRLKALDLLRGGAARSRRFPILVETYRDVLQDAFDMAALRDVLQRHRERRDRDARGGDGAPVAVRGEPAVRLRDRLDVRRRHAARRASARRCSRSIARCSTS